MSQESPFLDRIRDFWKRNRLPFPKHPDQVLKGDRWSEEDPLLSVVIPCYNHGEVLGEAVDSILGGSWADLEILVVDDGSDQEGTRKALGNFSRPKTVVLRHDRNRGLPAARNTGIDQARGKYVCCLDADDKLAPSYLEKATLLLESNQGVDLVYAWTQVFGEEDRVWHAPAFDPEDLIDHNLLNPPAVFRRRAWEQVGGFREELRAGYEDWEFWIRLARAGYRGYRIPEKLIHVRRVGRSFIHRAADRHDQLVAQIRRLNPEVYQDTSWLEEVRAGYKDLYLEDPLVNLRDPDAYRKWENPALWVLSGQGRGLKRELKDLWETIDGHEGDAILVLTKPVGEEVLDELAGLIDWVYALPHFLPRYAWESFLEESLQGARAARLRSKLPAGW